MARYAKEYSTVGPLSKLHRTWYDMRLRCSGKLARYDKYYKDKGIKVCDDWESWPSFALWSISNGWVEGLEIDRINNSLGYTPDNCRFVDHIIQNQNRDLAAAHKGIREGQTKRWSNPFVCIDTGDIFLTQIEASRTTGVDRKSLRMALSGKYQQAGGYKWKYVEAS